MAEYDNGLSEHPRNEPPRVHREHPPLQRDVPHHTPMSEKRGQRGFVKVGDLAANAVPHLIPGSQNVVPTVHQATEQNKAVTAQARHHFNGVRQIDALSRIGEDRSPDMGFMTRMLTLCSLPRTDPGDR
jgi:hypothetical protein